MNKILIIFLSVIVLFILIMCCRIETFSLFTRTDPQHKWSFSLFTRTDPLYNGNKWKGYRLGDSCKDYNENGKIIKEKRRDTIARKCYTWKLKNKKSNIDIDFFSNIVGESKIRNPIVLHLRVGDVIEDNVNSVDYILSNSNVKFNSLVYTITYKNLETINKKIPQKSTITLLAGAHVYRKSYAKSHEYIDKITDYFRKKGHTVNKILGSNPDDAFRIMCSAKYLIPTGGGFSELASEISKYRGNTVIWKDEESPPSVSPRDKEKDTMDESKNEDNDVSVFKVWYDSLSNTGNTIVAS